MSWLDGVANWLGFGAGPTLHFEAEVLLLGGPELGMLSPPAPEHAKLAPYPMIDRYPVVLGANLTLQSISSAFRSAQTGYRQQYVDVLDELLEREPHGFAVLSQRILSVTGGRLEFTPPESAIGTADEERAAEIRDFVAACYDAIPNLQQSLTALQWAVYYGATAAEISWQRDGNFFRPSRLHMIHSRRIAWPDPSSWSVHIWDQSMVGGIHDDRDYPTQKFFGIRAEDYPGKFIVHLPQLRGDYPTREGLGREVAYWFAIKGMAARAGSQWIERFSKPWALGYYATGDVGKPRTASDDDIQAGNAALAALGVGPLAGALLPDSIKLELSGPGMNTPGRKLAQRDWAEFCDLQVSKAVLTVTDTVEQGENGGRASTEVRSDKQKLIIRYDADCLAAALHHGLTEWIVKLNFPGEEHLTPRTALHVDEKPDPVTVIELAVKAVGVGMPVDANDLAERVGLKLTDPKDKDARRLVPLKPVDIWTIDPTIQAPAPPQLPVPGVGKKPGESDEDKTSPPDTDKAKADEPADEDQPDAEDAKPNGHRKATDLYRVALNGAH